MKRFQINVHTLAHVACNTKLGLSLAGRTSPDEKASLLCGTAVHAALAAYLRENLKRGGDRTPRLDWVKDFAPYEVVSQSLGLELGHPKYGPDRRRFANVKFILEAVFRRWQFGLPFDITDPRMLECDFAFPLGEADDGTSIELVGTLDGIVRDKRTGSLMILEHKTTGKLDAEYLRQWQWNVQCTGYIWAAQKVTGEKVLATWLNAIEIKNVPSSDKKCPNHGVPYFECGPNADDANAHIRQTFHDVYRTPEQLDEFAHDALVIGKKAKFLYDEIVKDGIEAVSQKTNRYGRFSNECKWCDFEPWCIGQNRNAETLDKSLPLREIDTGKPYIIGYKKES